MITDYSLRYIKYLPYRNKDVNGERKGCMKGKKRCIFRNVKGVVQNQVIILSPLILQNNHTGRFRFFRFPIQIFLIK